MESTKSALLLKIGKPQQITGHSKPAPTKLTSFSQFQKVRKQGRTVHALFLRISCLPMPQEEYPREGAKVGIRLGLVTSRRVGTAVERNRIRRRLREIFRKLQIGSRHWWVVVTAKPGVGGVPFSVLQDECLHLLRKLSILPEQR